MGSAKKEDIPFEEAHESFKQGPEASRKYNQLSCLWQLETHAPCLSPLLSRHQTP
jgi:hypothetical protein